MAVRKEVAQFTRDCDVLLNGISSELTETELQLVKAYTERLQSKLKLNELQPISDS